MAEYEQCVIKSFKHNGSLHRMWERYWLVPRERLHPAHAAESMLVLVTHESFVTEHGGETWTSRVPSVAFFIPDMWFNIIALIESGGIRYYCNVASPVYRDHQVLTYIDYDLDVIRYPNGSMHVVDRDEYEVNRLIYHYSREVQRYVAGGLRRLTDRIRGRREPFSDDKVLHYYHEWMAYAGGGVL